jgi:hypothetical protein
MKKGKERPLDAFVLTGPVEELEFHTTRDYSKFGLI